MIELRGIPLELHPEGEGVSDGIRRSGDFYEAEILDYLAERYPEQGTIVDGGAFIGTHATYFAAFLRHEAVHAFEPVPANFRLLSVNAAQFPTITCYQLALSSRARTLQMDPREWNMGASRVVRRGPLKVRAVVLDQLGLERVTLLKIDVENHERQVLAGARRTIARDHPLILIEDWTFGCDANHLPGYRLDRVWDERFTYLYRWVGA